MRLIACVVVAAGLLAAAEPLAQVFDQAVKALSNGDYVTAEKGFQQILAVSPDHIGALQNLGLVYSRTERQVQAIAIYRRGLGLSPHHKGLLMNLGLVYIQQESYADALPVFQDLVKIDPASLPARELLATCEFYTGQWSAAVSRFEALRREDPGNTELLYLLCAAYLKQDRPEKARQALEGFAATASPAQASLVLCQAYDAGGRFEEAAEHCRKALEVDPALPGAHRELGKALLNRHDPDADREFAAAIRQDPNDADAIYSLGVSLLQEDRIEEASDYLDRARRLRPGFWGNYFYLGKARLQMKQAEQAVPLLERAAELNPHASVLFYELGRALKATGRTEASARAMQRVRELRALELDNDAKALQKR